MKLLLKASFCFIAIVCQYLQQKVHETWENDTVRFPWHFKRIGKIGRSRFSCTLNKKRWCKVRVHCNSGNHYLSPPSRLILISNNKKQNEEKFDRHVGTLQNVIIVDTQKVRLLQSTMLTLQDLHVPQIHNTVCRCVQATYVFMFNWSTYQETVSLKLTST